VIEFGAGRRQLEKFLDQSCTYVPSDLVDRGPGTIICDLNERPLPDLHALKADVAVFGGVLEYIRDLPGLVAWLSRQFRCCVASYAYARSSVGTPRRLLESVQRAYFGYMNTYSERELVALFQAHGLTCIRRDTWNSQRLFLFERQQARQPS